MLDVITQFVPHARKGAHNKCLAFRGHFLLVCEGRDLSMKVTEVAVSMKGKRKVVTVVMGNLVSHNQAVVGQMSEIKKGFAIVEGKLGKSPGVEVFNEKSALVNSIVKCSMVHGGGVVREVKCSMVEVELETIFQGKKTIYSAVTHNMVWQAVCVMTKQNIEENFCLYCYQCASC